VIGFGPSGAVAAALLGQAGVRTWWSTAAHEVYPKPRAIALDHEIMRVFQNLGLLDAVAPHCEPFTPSEYYGVDGRLIKRLATVAAVPARATRRRWCSPSRRWKRRCAATCRRCRRSTWRWAGASPASSRMRGRHRALRRGKAVRAAAT
jgi:hypothetical protein